MQWKELESDIKLDSLTEAFRRLDCLSALFGMANFVSGIRVYIMRSCADSVFAHARSDRNEVGGLLLGHVFQAAVRGTNPADTLTLFTHAVPSRDYCNSPVSLEMGPEIWVRAGEHFSAGNIVAGWYHSHPYLGAFFSGADRRIQAGFFNQPYSVGWVIDPFRDEQKLFCGPESEEYLHPLLVVDDGLAMAQSH